MMSCTGLPGETPLAGCDMNVSYRYFSRSGRLKLAGCHRDGRPVGSWWRLVRGGGCVVGELDQAGQLTGHDIAYIYPDHLTVLLGQFCDGVMVAGVEHQLVGLKEQQGVKVPVFQRSGSDHSHVRQIGRYNHICDGKSPVTKVISNTHTTLAQIPQQEIRTSLAWWKFSSQGLKAPAKVFLPKLTSSLGRL